MKNILKHFALVGLIFFLMSSNALFAKDTDSIPTPKNWVTVGPFFTAGADVFAGEVPEGYKTDLTFAFSGGVFGAFNFSPKFAVALAAGYEKRGLYLRDQKSAANGESTTNINYFSIQPSLKFQAFLIGVTIDLPLSASSEYKQTVPTTITQTTTPNINDYNTLIDIRMGGMIPIMQNEKSDLNFFVQGSYSLTSAYKEYTDVTGKTIKSPLPTLQLGFCYTFELGK